MTRSADGQYLVLAGYDRTLGGSGSLTSTSSAPCRASSGGSIRAATSGVGGLNFINGGNGTDSMTFTGTMASVNAALNGMSFMPPANYNGPASISITTNDLGNSGFGGPLSDSDTINVTITPVNDKPAADAKNATASEDGSVNVVLSGSDVETPAASLTFTITQPPAHGTLQGSGAKTSCLGRKRATRSTNSSMPSNTAHASFEREPFPVCASPSPADWHPSCNHFTRCKSTLKQRRYR